MKILLADDSVTAQNMGKKILSEAGHEVVCVSNGATALKKVSEQEPDLVILDIYMPGYSGLEVCQKLKEASSTADLPVVLTVGKLEPFRKEDAQRVRAEALIVKPFEASELAAAVTRFAEIVSAKTPKSKPRGKLGPQPKAKPQWDEAGEDEFVTTTQKLEEQEGAAAETSSAEVGAEPPATAVESLSGETGREFEIKPEAEAAEGLPVAKNENESEAARETRWPNASGAEFSVQAEDARPGGEQPQVMAAAAGAGEESGNLGNQFGMNAATGSAPDFAVTAPVGAPAAEPSAFDAPMAESTNLASPADAAASAAPELSAASTAAQFASSAEPVVPGVDPAFDPDRTQWVTQFPTHFGIKEQRAEESEAGGQAGTEAEPASPEEIAAILSNLPGGGFVSSPEHAAEGEGKQPDAQPWPVEDSAPETSGWKAEEVPVEDQDKSISLAEEMNKAAGEVEPPVPEQAPALETASPRLPAGPPQTGTAEFETSAAPKHAGAPAATENKGGSGMGPAQPDTRVGELVSESNAAMAEPDRVTGVMHSAAMAIATRATVSAVTSQLHGQPRAEGITMGPSAIEELVGQVLERLKPKLIAEIERELKASEEK